jgi:hypothetical protein
MCFWEINVCSLDHVKNCFVPVDPDVVIRNGHVLKIDSFSIFEKRVRSPDVIEPTNRQKSVLAGHVVRQLQSVVLPALSKKYVRYKSLPKKKTLEKEKLNISKGMRLTQVDIIKLDCDTERVLAIIP